MEANASRGTTIRILRWLTMVTIGYLLSAGLLGVSEKIIIAQEFFLCLSLTYGLNSDSIKYTDNDPPNLIPLGFCFFFIFLPIQFLIFGFSIGGFCVAVSFVLAVNIGVNYFCLVYLSDNKDIQKGPIFFILCFFWGLLALGYSLVVEAFLRHENQFTQLWDYSFDLIVHVFSLITVFCLILSFITLLYYLKFPTTSVVVAPIDKIPITGNILNDLSNQIKTHTEYVRKIIKREWDTLANVVQLYSRNVAELFRTVFSNTGILKLFIVCSAIGFASLGIGVSLTHYLLNDTLGSFVRLFLGLLILSLLVLMFRATLISCFATTSQINVHLSKLIQADISRLIFIRGYFIGIYVMFSGISLFLVNLKTKDMPSYSHAWLTLFLIAFYFFSIIILNYSRFKKPENDSGISVEFTFWRWEKKQSSKYFVQVIFGLVLVFGVACWSIIAGNKAHIIEYQRMQFVADSLKKDSVKKDSIRAGQALRKRRDSIMAVLQRKRKDSLILVRTKRDSTLRDSIKKDSVKKDSLKKNSIRHTSRHRRKEVWHPRSPEYDPNETYYY